MRTSLLTASCILLLSSLVGCLSAVSALDGSAEAWDTGWWEGAPESDDNVGADSGDFDGHVEARWWSLTGSLTLSDGVVSKSDAALHLSFSGDLDGTVVSLCEADASVLAITPTSPPDHQIAFSQWWTVELTVPDPDDCVPPVFAESSAGMVSFHLGVGPVDPLLGPAMAGAGYLWEHWSNALHGLYLQTTLDDPLYIFGITATTEQLASSTPTPVEQGPLPDGTYQLRALYLIPL